MWQNFNGIVAIAALLQVCVFLKHWQEGKLIPAPELARRVRLQMTMPELREVLGQPDKTDLSYRSAENWQVIYSYQRPGGTLEVTLDGNSNSVDGWSVESTTDD